MMLFCDVMIVASLYRVFKKRSSMPIKLDPLHDFVVAIVSEGDPLLIANDH
jgi:hypothetical protein